jgi:hypothetical protein
MNGRQKNNRAGMALIDSAPLRVNEVAAIGSAPGGRSLAGLTQSIVSGRLPALVCPQRWRCERQIGKSIDPRIAARNRKKDRA